MALALVFSVAACGQNAAPEAESTAQNAEEAKAADTKDTEDTGSEEDSADEQTLYPITLTDQLGREVTIEKEPQTLVSGYYISTSLLIALGCKDKLTGVEAKAASREIYHLSAPELIDLPSVGSAKEFDLEGCAALNPDLVVVPVRLKDSISTLEELGLTVLAVNPEDQELLAEAALLLGKATNTLSAADSLIRFWEDHLASLKDALANAKTPSVYLASNSSLLAAAGPEMYQDSLIINAGGTNAAAELTDDYWAEISYEQLLAWDPEYIILAADADYTVDSVVNDPNLAECRAVKEGNVFKLPNAIESWDSPVPGSMLGSLWLASILYETFYGFTPDLENLYAEE